MGLARWIGYSSLLPALGAIGTAQALADSSVSAGAGMGFGGGLKGPGLSLGGEYDLKISSIFEVGGSLDHTSLRYSDGQEGAVDFYGGLLRLRHPGLGGVAFDVKLGASRKSAGDADSGLAPGLGIGASYRIPLGDRLAVEPRLGWRYMPEGAHTPEHEPSPGMAEVGVHLSFVI